MNQLQRRPDSANLFERLEQLNQVGVALSVVPPPRVLIVYSVGPYRL